jgi:hypothetical protein
MGENLTLKFELELQQNTGKDKLTTYDLNNQKGNRTSWYDAEKKKI